MATSYFASLSGKPEDIHQKYFNLLNNKFLSDVTFIIGEEGTRVPGHSFVLMLCSWDFYNIFKLLKLDEYEFIIKDVPETSFMAFLENCYTYSLDLKEDKYLDKTMDILKLSQRFHMETLEKICVEHVSSNLSTMNSMNIFKHKELFPADSSVLNTALKYIGENFMEIVQVEKNIDIFVNLSLDEVVNFEERCLTISCDEKKWFDILMKWAKKACEKQNLPPLGKNLRMVLGDLFYEIRFPDMKAKCFLEIYSNYHDLLTVEEIMRISRKINGNTADCPGFKCVPHLTYNSDSRAVLFGNPAVHFFTGPLEMDQGMTDEMTSKLRAFFRATAHIKFLGFAFVAKRNEMVNVTSCELTSGSGDHQNITTNPDGRYRINENYDLIAIRFERENAISPGEWRYLQCKFDKPVPNLSSGEVYNIEAQGISYKFNENSSIPYLIFSEPHQ